MWALTSSSSGGQGRRRILGASVQAGAYFPGELADLRAGGVDEAYAVVGEVGHPDDPSTAAGCQAGGDIFAVSGVTVAGPACYSLGWLRLLLVRRCACRTGRRCRRWLWLGAAGLAAQGDLRRCRAAGCADRSGVSDVVVADDTDGDAEKVVDVGLTLAAVGGVQSDG